MPEEHTFLSYLADLTPWGGLAIVICAIFIAMKKGVKLIPVPKNADDKPGKWAWIAVAILWVVVMLNYFDRQLMSVLNKSITEGADCIPMTQEQFGAITAVFLLIYAILSPIGGYLADRFSRKLLIMVSLVVWSIVTYMTGASSTYTELFIWRALMGVSEAFYIPAALALITDYHRGKTRSLATGLHMSGIYAGQALAGYGALMAGDPCQLGWRLTFEVFGFIGVAYALVVILFLRDPEGTPAAQTTPTEEKIEEKESTESNNFTMGEVFRGLFSTRAMSILLLMIFFAGFANWFLLSWYPRLLQDMFDMSESAAGPHATQWSSIAKYVAVLAAAVIADRWYLRNCNARAYVPGIAFCVAGPCVLLAMICGDFFIATFGKEIAFAIVLALVATQGVAQGSIDATLMPVLRSSIDERFSATGYGLLNFVSAGVGALITWIGGMMKDAGFELSVILSTAGVLMFLCGALLFCLPKKKQEDIKA